MPHLALPVLTAYLRAQGVEVLQHDLNVEVFNAILTREYLGAALARLRQQARHQRGNNPRAYEWAFAQGPALAEQIEPAVQTLRSDAFLDGPQGLRAVMTVDQSLTLASLPYHPGDLNFLNYTPPTPVDSSQSLLRAVGDSEHNIFLDLYKDLILADIEREHPALVGISIITMDQMLAGLTLGYLIKQAGLPCHVTLGGPHISMLRERLPRTPEVFQLFDSAVVFDGERALLRLAEALDGNSDLSKVPNLIYKDGAHIRSTLASTDAKAALEDEFLLPDFDGLPLDSYLTPKLVLPLRASKGCYHGRCAFCNVGYGGPQTFKPRPAADVVEDMVTLHKRYGTEHIFFADEAIIPHTLRDMSTSLADQGAPLHWCTCARFDKGLSAGLLDLMAQGGCRMLLFGLETASDKIIRHMNKGTTRAQTSRILRDSAQAGIWTHTFFFFGFPTETLDDAQETVDFVYAHQQAIHSASLGTFLLERYAPAHLHPQKYGIRRVLSPPDRDLAIYFDYEVTSGLDEIMAERVADSLLKVLPEKRFGHYYVHDVYRFIYASHLHTQGHPFPPWLVPEES